MISAEQRARIRRLFFAEHWKMGTIAAELGIHRDTVARAIETERFTNIAFRTAAAATSLDPYKDFVRATLEQHPRLRSTRLLQMIQGRGYAGSVWPLRRFVRETRPTSIHEAFFRLSMLAGEQGQVDWGSFGSIAIGNTRRWLSCFVMVLSFSRALFARFVLDQTLESFLRCHHAAFVAFQGVPRSLLYDNLKAVVLERMGDVIRFNPRLLDFAGHDHFAPRPVAPARGNEKGRVERAIRYLRDSFFAARAFRSLDDLNAQLDDWIERVAHARLVPGDTDKRTVAAALTAERPRLLPLPAHPFDCDAVQTLRSGKTPYLRFDSNDYSIPHTLTQKPLMLVASDRLVRVLDGNDTVASHERSWERGRQMEDPRHLGRLVRPKAPRPRASRPKPAHGHMPERPSAPRRRCPARRTSRGHHQPASALAGRLRAFGNRAGSGRIGPTQCLRRAIRRPYSRPTTARTKRSRSHSCRVARRPSRARLACRRPSHGRLRHPRRPHQGAHVMSDLRARLHALGLTVSAAALDDLVALATKKRWGATELFEHVADIEEKDRARRGLDRRLARSRLEKFKVMVDFDWNWPDAIDRPLVESLLSLDFLEGARNVVLVANSGLGKTMIAKNITHRAILAGRSVLFLSAAQLLLDLGAQESARALDRRLHYYAKIGLLVIDELGFLAFDNRNADLIFQVVSRRYEKKSLVLTTNLAFAEWHTVFPSATCATALVERVVHLADIVKIEGKSYRVRESQLDATTRGNSRREKKPPAET
jgi:DNA replication protein DnaC/transposase